MTLLFLASPSGKRASFSDAACAHLISFLCDELAKQRIITIPKPRRRTILARDGQLCSARQCRDWTRGVPSS